jgi:hypothetical protein
MAIAVTFSFFIYTDLERDLDVERRKNRDLQETSRERDKEYQRLKVCDLSARIR